MGELLGRLDRGYYRVEKVIVIGALAVMALTVFLEVVHRRLVAPDSAITGILLLPKKSLLQRQAHQTMGGAKNAAQVQMEVEEKLASSRAWLDRHVSPLILAMLLYLLALAAVQTAARRRREVDPVPRSRAIASLAACLVVSAAVVHLPPGWRWVPLLLLTLGALLVAHVVGSWRPLVLAAAVTAGLALLAWMIVSIPSRWTYVILLTLIAAGIALGPLERERPGPRLAAACGGFVVVLFALFLIPDGFSWAKEIAMLLLLWVGFIGASMAAHTRQHIMIDFLRKLVPERYRSYYEGASALFAAAFTGLLTYLAYLYVFGAPAPISIYSMDAHLDYTGLPSWIGVAAIPMGLATTTLRFLGLSVRAFKGELEPAAGPMALPAPEDKEPAT